MEKVIFIYIYPVPKRNKITDAFMKMLSTLWGPGGNITHVFIPGLKLQTLWLGSLSLMNKEKEQTEKCQLRRQIRENSLLRVQGFPHLGRSCVSSCLVGETRTELDQIPMVLYSFSPLPFPLYTIAMTQAPWTRPWIETLKMQRNLGHQVI